MGGGNGNKSHQARLAAQKKEAAKGVAHTSEDRKKMESAKNVVSCKICMTGFPRTVRTMELQTHLDNKHAKAKTTIAEAFPMFTAE